VNALLLLSPPMQSVLILGVGALMLLALGNVFTRAPVRTQLTGCLFAALAALPALRAAGLDVVAIGAPCALGVTALLLMREAELEFGEHHLDGSGLVLLGAAGGVVLGTAGELVSLLLGLETLSLTVAVLCGLGRGERSLEAAFKFFVLAAVSLGVLVYGTGLFAYATGSFALGAPPLQPSLLPVYQTAVVLLVLGIAFELAVVPLHFGALSAYMAMPTALATFAATAGKVGAGIALLRVAAQVELGIAGPVLQALGTASIAWATFAGFAQRDLRGVLAYSAVGHAGFLAIAIGCGPDGRQPAVLYLLVYAASTALTFAGLADRGTRPIPLQSFRSDPLPPGRALAVVLGLLSLAGMPPGPGLWAKVGVLVPAWNAGSPMVATLAALGGVFSALYYLRPVPDLLASIRRRPAEPRPAASAGALLLGALAVALFAAAPWLGSQLAQSAAR